MIGLNDGRGDEYNKCDTHVHVNNKMYCGISLKFNKLLSPDEFCNKLNYNLIHNISDVPNLLAMTKYNLEHNVVFLQDNLCDARNSIYFQWYTSALDIAKSKIFKPSTSEAKREAPTNVCEISFLNKVVKLPNASIFFMIHY